MPYCGYCGGLTKDTDNFCMKCGKAVLKPNENSQIANNNQQEVSVLPQPLEPLFVEKYEGRKCTHYMDGDVVVTVSEGMDAFNHYRKIFMDYAREEVVLFRDEYLRNIHNLDSFLALFENMYIRYRTPLLVSAVEVFPQYDIYDISLERFAELHGNEFCLVADDYKVIIESLNLTAQANQQRKINNYNMMPGFVFSGIGGLIAATAVNVAVSSIAAADINNVNVSPTQKMEIFHRINFHVLSERVFLDFWRIFLSLTWQLKKHGIDMWYPNAEITNNCKGVYQNILAGRIPNEKIASALGELLQNDPYNVEYYKLYVSYYGETKSILKLADYFGVEI